MPLTDDPIVPFFGKPIGDLIGHHFRAPSPVDGGSFTVVLANVRSGDRLTFYQVPTRRTFDTLVLTRSEFQTLLQDRLLIHVEPFARDVAILRRRIAQHLERASARTRRKDRS